MPQRLHALIVIVLGLMVAILDSAIVNLALPGIMCDLHASPAASIWVLNAYQVATLALLLPLASLGDRLGHRRVYLVGMGLFTLSSLVCALASTLTTLTAARALQGVGASGIMSVNASLVRLIYPRKLLGRGLAVNSLVVAASSVAGPSVAAAILSVASWSWLFLINLPLGLLTFWLGRRALPPNPPAQRPAPADWNWLDVVLNILTFALVFLGADGLGTHLDTHPAASGGNRLPLALAELAAGCVFGAWYVARQRRQALPLLPLDLLRIPVFAFSMCSSIGAFCAQMIALAGLPFLLLVTYGRTPLQAGVLLTAWPLAIVVVAPFVGRLIGRVPGGLLGFIGMALMTAGLVLLALMPAHPSDAQLIWRLALCGVGFAVFQSPNNHIIITSAPAHRSGSASGMLGSARLTGQTLGAVLLASVFSVQPPATPLGPTIALIIGACFALASGCASLLRVARQPVPA